MKNIDINEVIKNRKSFKETPASIARSTDGRFRLVEKEFPWGKRNVYIPIETQFNEQLQASRGFPLNLDKEIEDIKTQVSDEIDSISESDILRITELDYIVENAFSDKTFNSFCEIGFRIPKLQNFYKKRGIAERGFEINSFNVALGKAMGFDCREHNLNKPGPIEIEGCDLIVCYHMLEHVSDPFQAVKCLYDSASPGSLFHIEIPVEEDGPRIKYGHLYPFFKDDMGKMLELSGFKIISLSSRTHTGGPWVERYSALKE
jgi:hypothetical protein